MQYDSTRYKIWKLPHPLILHWVLNPGLAVNELLLGQRVPKVTLTDKTSTAPLMERQYVPCPQCGALNDARLWTKSNAAGHWFGLVCPECGEKIPCLWNLTSLVVLACTFPIWIWIKVFYEKKWLERERGRFVQVQESGLQQAKNVSWLRMGLYFGMFMFIFSLLQETRHHPLSRPKILVLMVIWTISGLCFGLMMKYFLSKRK